MAEAEEVVLPVLDSVPFQSDLKPTMDEDSQLTSPAAVKVQKVYKSYRTRRRLADSAVVAEELWWQAIDFAKLNHSTVSFFDYSKPESISSKWNRIGLNASKVGKGLSRDGKALKLAFQQWIEAVDPRHRYGHNLHFYYEHWCESDGGQPFFYWLDIGDGRNVDLKECPRTLLREQVVKYLGPQERDKYEYDILDGKLIGKLTGEFLDTANEAGKDKWIFVMSTNKKLYVGKKKKGKFHHSSFLAGGATLAAGRIVAEDGILKSISAYSGHYKPGEENLKNFIDFLNEKGIDQNGIEIHSSSNDDYYEDKKKEIPGENEIQQQHKPQQLNIPFEMMEKLKVVPSISTQKNVQEAGGIVYSRSMSGLSGGLQSPRADVPQKAILQRMKSKEKARSYQLGHQLPSPWSTGAGPRIGCVNDYPLELRMQALEFVSLSPRLLVPTPSTFKRFEYSPPAASAASSPASVIISSD